MIKTVKNIMATIFAIIIALLIIVVMIICSFIKAIVKLVIMNLFAVMGFFNLVNVHVKITSIKKEK